MRRIPLIILLAASACVSSTAFADEISFADRIAPRLTDSTIALARVPLERVDFVALGDAVEKQFSMPEEIKLLTRTALVSGDAFRVQLTAAGVTDLVVAVDLEFALIGPYAFLVYKEGANPERIKATVSAGLALAGMAGQSQFEVEDFGGMLFIGPVDIRDRLKSSPPVERPQLETAFASVADYELQIVFCPSVHQRRAIREAVPAFPKPFNDINGEVLSRGLQSAAIGAKSAPNLEILVLIESADAQSAETLLQAQHRSLRMADENPRITEHLPQVKDITKLLEFQRNENRLSVKLDLQDETTQTLANVVWEAFQPARTIHVSNRLTNNLKQFGLALHNWHDSYSVFPAHANYSEDGKPLLSWRVHLLPYLGQQVLYSEFHLDEPWDSEHNRKLIPRMPDVFAVPGSVPAQPGKTGIVYPILKSGGSFADGTKNGTKFQDMKDGTSNIVIVVVADDEHSVIWTKPDDLVIDPEKPFTGLRNVGDTFVCLFGDGSVRRIPTSIDAETWVKILTIDGGEPVKIP